MNAFEQAKQLGRDLKNVAGKAALHLLPYVSLVEASKVAAFGAKKYPPGWTWTKATDNWREVYGSAVMRHAAKWSDPTISDVDIDPETGADVGSGLSHMAHVCFVSMICLWHEHRERQERQAKASEPEPPAPIEITDLEPVATIKLPGSLVPHEPFGLYRVIVRGPRPLFCRTRELGFESFVIVDDRVRDLLFVVPSFVTIGDLISVEAFGWSGRFYVEHFDFMNGRMTVTPT